VFCHPTAYNDGLIATVQINFSSDLSGWINSYAGLHKLSTFCKNVADLWHDLLGHEIAAAVSVTVAVAFEECFCH